MGRLVLRPTGAGSLSQCTPVGTLENWDCVNEETADDDTTYIQKGIGGVRRDLYLLESFEVPHNGTITHVTLNWKTKSTETPQGSAGVSAFMGYGVDTDLFGGVGGGVPSASYQTFSISNTQHNILGTPWDWESLADTEFGLFLSSLVNGVTSVTQFWVEVVYVKQLRVPQNKKVILGVGQKVYL